MKSFLLFVLYVVGSLLSVHVFTVLWTWFVVPTFGATPLSLPMAFGLKVVVGLLRLPERFPADDRGFDEKLTDVVGLKFLAPIMALCYGWAAHYFV